MRYSRKFLSTYDDLASLAKRAMLDAMLERLAFVGPTALRVCTEAHGVATARGCYGRSLIRCYHGLMFSFAATGVGLASDDLVW
jgi:hypothetical protein